MAPQGLRNVRAEDAVRAFVRAGGHERMGKGSHRNIKMPNGALVTIPLKGVVKVGLLNAAVRRAGLTHDEFAELLGRRR